MSYLKRKDGKKAPFKIAICGVHGVGKSTLCNWLAYQYKREGYNAKVVNECVRYSPFPVNDRCSLESQMWIVSRQIQDELTAQSSKYELIVCDRSVYDPVVYGFATNVNDKPFLECEKFARSWCETYDSILVIRAHESDIPVHDNFRSTDIEFFKEVNRLFLENMESMPNVNIVDSHKVLAGDYRGIKEHFDAAIGESAEDMESGSINGRGVA